MLITSQNHGFAVDERRCRRTCAPRTCRCSTARCRASRAPTAGVLVPGPSRSPGPRDVGYLFDRFIALMEKPAEKVTHAEARRFKKASSSSAPARSSSGQACEFDYSGAQACKALREEGYRVILVNSNPATIMTDPGMADATYIEPITWQVVEKIIEEASARRAPCRPMGGQTALNCALDLPNHGVLAKYGVEMIGANEDAIEKAEDREKFKDAMTKIGSHSARSASRARWTRRSARRPGSRLPMVIRPSFTLGGTGGGIAYNQGEFEEICKRGLDASPTNRAADRGVADRLEGIRDGGGPRQRRTTASSSARSRTSTRWACTPATRSPVAPAQTLTDKEYQIMRDASIASCARSASTPAAPTCSSRSTRTTAAWSSSR